MVAEYGLVVVENHKYVALPLEEVVINTTILKDLCCEVSVTQRFRVASEISECSYRFPLPSTAAIHTFQAHLVNEGRTITGEVQEKEQARETYENAKSQGMNAYLMERTMADVFSMSIGNLAANEQVDITLKYVSELDFVDGKINWTLPVALAPRYGANYSATTVDYPISLTLDCWCTQNIIGITYSDAYSEFITITVDPTTPCHQTLTMDTLPTGITDDLNFMIIPESTPEVTAVLERSLEYNTETLRITVQKNSAQLWNETEGVSSENVEIYFLLDTSGSMSGGRMRSLKEAMQIFLRSLPEHSRYQLIEFNSSYTQCFSEHVVNNSQEALNKASEWCKNLQARGGTQILNALQGVYNSSQSTNTQDYKRCIIVLTDGDVYNTDQCINLVNKNAGAYRVFTLGVGASFSEGLCRGLANAGNGLFRAARNTDEIAGSCIAILQATFASTITSHNIGLGSWDDGQVQHRYPEQVSFIPGQKTNLYFVKNIALEGGNELPPIEEFTVDISLCFSNAPSESKMVASIPVSTSPLEGHQDLTVSTNKIIHQLMAKARITELEKRDDHTVKDECVAIGERYNLVSKFTSFVAVNYREGIQTGVNALSEPQTEMLDDMMDFPLFHSAGPQLCSSSRSFIKSVGSPQLHSLSLKCDSRTSSYRLQRSSLNCASFTSSATNDIDAYLQRGEPLEELVSRQSDQLACQSQALMMSKPKKKKGMFSGFGTAIGNFFSSAFSSKSKEKKEAVEYVPEAKLCSKRYNVTKSIKTKKRSRSKAKQSSPVNFNAQVLSAECDLFDDYGVEEESDPFGDYGVEEESLEEEESPELYDDDSDEEEFDYGLGLEDSMAPVPTAVSKVTKVSAPAITTLTYSALIQAQNFDGSFSLDLTIIQVNGMDQIMQEYGLNDAEVMTIVAIWLFINRFSDKQHEWVLMVNKAKKWVFNNTSIDLAALDECLAKLS